MNDLRLEVSIDDQRLYVRRGPDLERTFVISTAAKGAGFTTGSHRTPTGRFVVVQKIGDGMPSGTIFTGREPVGTWHEGEACEKDHVLTRIIRISGLDPANANTFDRYIYFHGTPREDLLGSPASCGCIRLSNADAIALHDLVEPGMELTIHPPVRRRGKLVFFDCDSTLSSIEGIDELGRARGPEAYKQVEELTNRAMDGTVPIREVFGRRMEIIRPDRDSAERVARQYVETITPGTRETIAALKDAGWTPVILSGGFEPLIRPLARELGIDHVEAVPLHFDAEGNYAGYGADYPTTRNGGKPEIIREWQQAMLPEVTVMVGDGVSDLETLSDVDRFIGFGGVVEREPVKRSAGIWANTMLDVLDAVLSTPPRQDHSS